MKYCLRFSIVFLFALFFISCGKQVAYNVGDIVMDDGTVVSASQLEAYSGKAEPMAVIFSVTGGEHENSSRVLGVGYKASKPVIFTQKDSAGNKSIMANYCVVAAQEYQIATGQYTNGGFLGLVDGRKSWKNVAQYDTSAKESYAKYPAYDFALVSY